MKKLIHYFNPPRIRKPSRHYTMSLVEEPIKMPDFNYVPKPYDSVDFEKIQQIKTHHVVPCIQQYYKKPLLLHQGKMQWLFDHEGKRYLDMFGGIVTVSVGHCHPKINEVAKKQIETLWHSTNVYQHPNLYKYAEELTSTLPSHLKVVYFVNSGSEANDLAVFLSRLYTGNYDIVSFRNGYHGISPSMMGVTALSTYKYNIPVSFGVHHAMNPDVFKGLWGGKYCRDSLVQTTRDCDCPTHRCKATENYYKQLEQVFLYSIPRGHVSALMAESIQGVGGIVHFPKGFLKKAYELVRTNGGICIADEVQTGFGRTGEHFWGFQMHDVKPDIVTMAKGIGNGFPLAALVTTEDIANVLKYSSHFNTFGGNPFACAIGSEVLKVIKEEEMQYNSKSVGTYLIKQLATLREQFECVGDVRGKGLMIGVEFVKNKTTNDPLGATDFVDIWEDCKNMGVLIGRGGINGNVMRFAPPMCVTMEDAKFAYQVLRQALINYYKERRTM